MPMPDPMRDGEDELYHLLSCADALHCENPLKVEEDWIRDYHLLLQGHIRAADFAFIRAIYPDKPKLAAYEKPFSYTFRKESGVKR